MCAHSVEELQLLVDSARGQHILQCHPEIRHNLYVCIRVIARASERAPW